MQNFTRFFGVVALLLYAFFAYGQGSTTGSMNGKVSDSSEPLIGANVLAVHLPTGTTYGNSTNIDGLYRLPNMRVGGPYTVTVSYTGYDDFIKENVYLQLGQSLKLDAVLRETSVELEGVEVVASRTDVFNGQQTGAETNVSEREIAVLPQVSRAIGDFARLTPQATIREGNDGFAISLNGMNNRFNAIYLDGAVSNDVFGLAGSGTNGGQTGVSPISVDAIESFQIALAPFDVRLGGFAGGAINAVTRSGSNNVEASVYTFYRNEKLSGLDFDRPTFGDYQDEIEQETGVRPSEDDYKNNFRLDDFTALTTGFRIGAPIIKDKFFFFLNAEIQRDETPRPFDVNLYNGDSSPEKLEELTEFIQAFGYEPGTYTRNRATLDSEKITARFDYNINRDHKLSFRHGYTRAVNLEGNQSNARTINYLNRSEFFESVTNTSAIELNSVFGVNMANNFKLNYTAVRDDRDPFQGGDQRDERDNPNYFPTVTIEDGSGEINFGAEPFSTANNLDQDVITLTNNLEIYKGRHNITLGTHNEFYKMNNLFIPFNYGSYEFASVDDFLNDSLPTLYSRNYSLKDDVTGDGSAAGTEFNAGQIGLYVQDEFQVTDKFRLTFGLRADMPLFSNPPRNDSFNINTIPLLEAAGYDLRGANVGDFIKPQVALSPRIGFNLDLSNDRSTQLRGGIGIFTSRIPLVWPGGAYNNNGLNQGAIFTFSPDRFNPDWDGQTREGTDPNNPQPGGNVDLFAEDLKLPRFLKVNVALDQKLPWGMIGNVDLIFNKTLNNVAYQNLNLPDSIGTLSGTPDNRPVFNRRSEVDDTYNRIIIGYNEDRGYSYNTTVSLTKPFDNGFQGTLAYSYGDSYAVFDGTSSQNSSQWRGLYAINGRNFDQRVTRSDFSQGSRIIAAASYRLDWNKERTAATTFSIFHESLQGEPFSYVYDDRGALNNEDSREFNLIYIPADESEIILVDDGDRTAAQQWADLDDFIESDKYLRENRGGYAERNASRGPWNHILDFKLLQDFTLYTGGKSHELQLTFDIFNFTNLLNRDWGRRAFVSSNFQLIDFEGYDSSAEEDFVPTFTFGGVRDNDPSFTDDSGIQSSRWQMQVGLRYTFR